MKKPTVYLDASYISAFWYEGDNLAMLARRFHTREWWMLERRRFQVLATALVEAELSAGVYPWQQKCVRMVNRLNYITHSKATREFTDELIEYSVVPEGQLFDAAHLAISTVNGLDYLLTWNYAHLANPMVQSKLDELCKEISGRRC